ncbi:MAG TPA: NYN domain-containing protein [Pseudomonadales bacterium]
MNSDGNLALFCDFENVALGVRDAKYERFDIRLVLERLLVKGSIVVKKAYCDWDRYREFKAAMHEAAFEMIEIPHIRQSGKNSADIRMVVDALDLCYTKEHIDTFVIISGDSDFSPLVSKLRENAKTVIGVGVKNATSDLLMSNCDEFIFYDDLVRQKKPARKRSRSKAKAKSGKVEKAEQVTAKHEEKASGKSTAADDKSADDLMQEAIDLVLETAEALYEERGERGNLWGSMVKQTLKRRRPGFNESFYGFRSFSDLLEEAQARGEMELELDEKSGGYIIRSIGGD